MKITKGKTERILLGLLLCSVISSSAYAAEVSISGGDYHEAITGEEFNGISGSSAGGVISVSGSGSTLEGVENSTFTENGSTGNGGGAIYNYNNATIGYISSVTFEDNYAYNQGGAIYNYNSSIGTIEGSTFSGNNNTSGNSSRGGGAIYNNGGTIGSATVDGEEITGGIEDCTFTSNTGNYNGGAIYNYNGGSITYIKGTVTVDGDDTASSSYFYGNSARYGGAIYNYTNAEIGYIEGTIFDTNTASYNGGAIDNNTNSSIGYITNTIFTGNTAASGGGAIYNYDGATIGYIENSTFTGNQATSSSGGAIYNYNGEIGDITGTTFSGNTATSNGGAIYNYAYGGTALIGNIKNSVFTDNHATGSTNGGGAIYNTGTGSEIGDITGSYFEGNSASTGGAIENRSVLGDISDSSFISNVASGGGGGGAIMNEDTMGSITNTVFQENEATGNGGAIYTTGGTMGSITGSTFYGNTATGYGGGIYDNGTDIEGIFNSTFSQNYAMEGGALYNGGGTISAIGGVTFDTNTASNYGGAIRNFGTITTITSYTDDSGNTVYTTFTGNKSDNNAGAIYNYNNATIGTIDEGTVFSDNKAANDAGAIYNGYKSVITSITGTTFSGNKAESGNGGAIYNYDDATIGSITNSVFTSNTAGNDGGAIYNFWETESGNGEGVIGDITGSTFTENTAGDYGGAIFNYGYIGLDADGNTTGGISNSTFTGNQSNRGGAIYNGIQRGETASGEFDCIITSIDNCYFYQNVAEGFGGAIYNYDDGYIWNISNNIFEENEARGGNGGAIENSESGSDIGTISGNTFVKNTATGGGAAIYNEGIIDSITDNTFQENQAGTYGGAIYNNGGTISEISGDTFTGNSAVSEDAEAAGGAIYNSGTISTFSVKDLSGNYAEGATGAMGGAIYDEGKSEITIDGDVTDNYATASSGEALGGAIYAGEGTVVTLSGNITGNSASGDTALGGAIYNAGTVNVNIENKDAVISGNTAVSGGTEEANVLYGEAASVTNFNLTDATLRLDDSVTGETGFEVNISGNGIDATTFYMYNDILDSNLSIGGTTLNTINGEAHTYNVNQFTVSGDFDMQADINLGNETMDRFVTNGNNYGDAQGTLNVSALNVVKDTSKTRVGVYFAEPGLKEDVTSSVSDVMGPVNTYSVSYDKNYDGSWGDDGGYFVFDKTGTNPAARTAQIAQMGAFNAMNMMFEYCFEHSDYYMKLPSETRLAIREKAKAAKAEKLAAKNGTTVEEEAKKIDDARAEEMASREGDKFYDHDNVLPLYDQHELTRPGAWVKTFATKESIPFKGEFTARDKYYGGIIGVDSDFREDKKGWGNVFTGYAGYQGIHQSFSGGSVRQDGGMLGATETFYKKNFYTAWTVAAASTRAKARNMYGHESSRLYTYGIASKSGWNLEYDGGKYIVLPTFMVSYTNADMRSYTNAAGLKVDADNMRAVQLNPNIKWIRNYNNGWQPYLTAGEVWTVGQKSRVRVDGTKLDELHLRPYTEYGLGVQKRWAHDYDGYAEFLGHAGGRRGFLAKIGFRWTFN